MDGTLAEIQEKLAQTLQAALAPTIPDLQVTAHMNINPTQPSIDIYPGDPFQEAAAFGLDSRELFFTVRARVSSADQPAGQARLLELLEPGSGVEAALYNDDALDGVAVAGVSGFTDYDDGDTGRLLGCEWRVRVLT